MDSVLKVGFFVDREAGHSEAGQLSLVDLFINLNSQSKLNLLSYFFSKIFFNFDML